MEELNDETVIDTHSHIELYKDYCKDTLEVDGEILSFSEFRNLMNE